MVSDGNNKLNIENHKNSQGYYSIPRETWHTLDADTQEHVKKFNGDLRKSRKNGDKNHNGRENDNERKMTTRRAPAGNDDNPSSKKKFGTVQFKDSDDSENMDARDDLDEENGPENNIIRQRRGEILSFQVKGDKE